MKVSLFYTHQRSHWKTWRNNNSNYGWHTKFPPVPTNSTHSKSFLIRLSKKTIFKILHTTTFQCLQVSHLFGFIDLDKIAIPATPLPSIFTSHQGKMSYSPFSSQNPRQLQYSICGIKSNKFNNYKASWTQLKEERLLAPQRTDALVDHYTPFL